jgi:hypothetical protein
MTKHTSMRVLPVVLLVSVLVVTVAFSKRPGVGGEASSFKVVASTEIPRGTAQSQKEFKSTVRVFIHPDDIYPAIVTVRPGKVVLSAENNTIAAVNLVVESVSSPGQRAAHISASAQDKRVRQEYTLAPGEYIFYEESRPGRYGRLLVDPKFK